MSGLFGACKRIAALTVYSALTRLIKAKRPDAPREKTVAVVFMGALGDLFVMCGAANALHDGGYSLTLICREGYGIEDAASFTGLFDEIITLRKGLIKRLGNMRRLKRLSVETAFPAPLGRHPLADIYTLSVGAKRHILPDTELDMMSAGIKRTADKKADELVRITETHELKRYKELLNSSGLYKDDLQPFTMFGEQGRRSNTVVLFPGASSAEKKLPVKTWAEVLKNLHEATGCKILIMGAGADAESCREAETLLRDHGAVNVCGRFSVTRTLKILSRCRLALANDSGGAHMGLASSTPTVIACGKWQYGRFFPYDELSGKAAAVFAENTCSRCGKSIPDCRGGKAPARCVAEIKGEELLRRSLELLR